MPEPHRRAQPPAGAGEDEPADVRAAAFEGLPMSAAILDPAGRIVTVNAAWRLFGELNRPPSQGPLPTWSGVSYLEVCRRAADAGGTGAEDATEAAEGVAAVAAGSMADFEMEYPCPAPAESRWFLMRASPLAPPHRGVTVLHLDITRRKRLEESLEHSATHDPLTGLPNRMLAQDRLRMVCDRRPRPGLESAVFFCDLDRFKAVNDALGHTGGDEVLSMAATRIEGAVRTGDTVARLGGDEFVVVCEDLRPGEAVTVASRIEAAFEAPFQVGAHAPAVGISVGWVTVHPGDDPSAVLRQSDLAMYERKQRRGSSR